LECELTATASDGAFDVYVETGQPEIKALAYNERSGKVQPDAGDHAFS
jgi:hypothetical protein